MLCATNRTTVFGSPKAPITAPIVTTLIAKKYTPTSDLESRRVSRAEVARPIMLAPTFPPTAQAPPESKRRLSDEPLKRPPHIVDPKRELRSSVILYP